MNPSSNFPQRTQQSVLYCWRLRKRVATKVGGKNDNLWKEKWHRWQVVRNEAQRKPFLPFGTFRLIVMVDMSGSVSAVSGETTALAFGAALLLGPIATTDIGNTRTATALERAWRTPRQFSMVRTCRTARWWRQPLFQSAASVGAYERVKRACACCVMRTWERELRR